MTRNQLISKDGETADAGVRGDGCGLRLPSRAGLGQGAGGGVPLCLDRVGVPPLVGEQHRGLAQVPEEWRVCTVEEWEPLPDPLLSWGALAKRKAGGVLEFEEEGGGPR